MEHKVHENAPALCPVPAVQPAGAGCWSMVGPFWFGHCAHSKTAQLSVALGAVLRSTQLCVGWGAVSAELERGQCVHASVLSRAYPVVPGVAGGKWIRGLCLVLLLFEGEGLLS